MIKLSSLKDKCRQRPGAVLGGGPSLPDDMARLPENCLLIAVNYHALYHCKPHYMVYWDNPEHDPAGLMPGFMETFQGIKVSPHESSDVALDIPHWSGNYSSCFATWLALHLGCDPVILCGMDCYTSERVYCHDYSHDVPVFSYPLDGHLRPWYEECRNSVPHPERIRVMSGPISQIFPSYL